MSGNTDKLKFYLFLSFILVLLSTCSFAYKCIVTNNIDILGYIGSFGTAFIPFASTFTIAIDMFNSASIEQSIITLVLTMITAIIALIQALLITWSVADMFPTVDV
jgi:hypothetical protein